jgi:hypothetical protein
MTPTRCPDAYALGADTQQGSPISVSDRIKLRRHYDRKDLKREAARERAKRIRLWEYSHPTQKDI